MICARNVIHWLKLVQKDALSPHARKSVIKVRKLFFADFISLLLSVILLWKKSY